ncbi:MAG: hypothetical protein H6602_00610 [Flavobacteriales bacterium]|nr:hypothetical protein [Flavobacteriales bacterium]
MKLERLILLVFVGLTVFAGLTRWQTLSEKPLIMTDGQGYYAYLPAVFIYHDLQFNFVDEINERYYPEDKRARFVVPTDSGNVNKYFVGTAVVQAPFFLAACVVTWFTEHPTDGYSAPFQLFVGLAALFYLLFGSFFLLRVLEELGYGKGVVASVLLLLVFATNLLFYTLYEPSMSHVYSFFTVSAFFYFGRRTLVEASTRAVLAAALFLGLTVLIRPINGLILLGLPMVSGGFTGMLNGIELLFQRKKVLLIGVLAVIAIVSIQPLVYLLQTGKPFVWSYQEEGFNFLSPELYNVLFSYRKGLFVYCPVLIIAVLGTIAGAFRRKPGLVEGGFFLGLISWVIASWWMWYYGGSYGHRAFIEFYPIFGIGLAYALSKGVGFLGPKLLIVSIPLWIALQMVQTYQYVNHIIPFDNMSKEKYWNLFLRTGDDLRWYYSGYPGEDSYRAIDSLLLQHDMEQTLGWGNEDQFVSEHPHSGVSTAKMEAHHQYGITLRKNVVELPEGINTVRVSTWVRPSSRKTDLSLVCAIEDSLGQSYFWRSYPLRPQFDGVNQWSWVTALFKCGVPRSATDRFVVYPMRSDGSVLYVDDFEVSFIKAQ